MIRTEQYRSKILAYSGGNQNAVTRLGHRKARNALARFLPMILSRLERKYRFRAHPLYISTLNNTYCDNLTRPPTDHAHLQAQSLGRHPLQAELLLDWFLPDNLPRLALPLPCDDPEKTDFYATGGETRLSPDPQIA